VEKKRDEWFSLGGGGGEKLTRKKKGTNIPKERGKRFKLKNKENL